MAVEITVLVDNEPSSKDPFLRTERGHSLHVRWNGRSLLLDTGISGLFADNARTLGIWVTEIDTVVLSHGRFDHSGGLGRFLSENRRATVYAASGVREQFWLSLFGLKKDVGLDPRVLADARERLHFIDADSEPEVGLHLLVRLPFTHPRPRGNRLLFRGTAAKRLPDDFADELVMALDDGDGETRDRPRSEVLVLWLEAELVHGAGEVFGSFQFSFDEGLGNGVVKALKNPSVRQCQKCTTLFVRS